jgi:hypothetical protein
MLGKYLDKENLSKEHIDLAYQYLKDYCDKNNQNVVSFVKNEDNIPIAAEYIYKQLGWSLRLILKPQKIEELIKENIDFIIEIAESKEVKPKGKKKTKTVT